jgi:hypothetical protein
MVFYELPQKGGALDIIHSAHFDWINLFIRDTNKCNFDTYKYSSIIAPTSFDATPPSGSSTARL